MHMDMESISVPNVLSLSSRTRTFNCSAAQKQIGYSPIVLLEVITLLYLFKLVAHSLTVAFGVVVVLAFMVFNIYEQYEPETDAAANYLIVSARKAVGWLSRNQLGIFMVSEELLWELFVQAGPVDTLNVYVPKDRITNSHQGYGFVEFRSEEDADYAIKVLNMIKLYGKPIRVNKS